MKAWILNGVTDISNDSRPLVLAETPTPSPEGNEILIKVSCCGVCHTELDEIEGRTKPPKYPVIPGHQVIGVVESLAEEASQFKKGDRVGVAWIYAACGICEYCRVGLENLCELFQATGRDANGGYAEYMKVSEKFVYRIPDTFTNEEAAPLLCAGAIGYRSLKLTNIKDGQSLGLTGFGASGHLVLKMAKFLYPTSDVVVFARSEQEQDFARSLGAYWVGNTSDEPPERLHAIIDTTPAWKPIVESLHYLRAGGRLIINAIRKENNDQSELLKLNYPDHLWMEKEIKSVANITRSDVSEFLSLAAKIPIKPEIEIYPFEEANKALLDLKHKHIKGAKVLHIS
ncbi:MAG TPA: zinc-dependent alcohol dehydrogenase family protein [Cyclobacteriaceae bacterium]|nr:zinc-dependent alcohol dehydrogenase family protein [Cyclobacteriaceae bacterium]